MTTATVRSYTLKAPEGHEGLVHAVTFKPQADDRVEVRYHWVNGKSTGGVTVTVNARARWLEYRQKGWQRT